MPKITLGCDVVLKHLIVRLAKGLTRLSSVSTQKMYKANEPRHEKTCFCHMRTAKVQISLRICAV